MEDCRIIDLFFARSEDAIAETDRKYGAYCRAVAARILCDAGDAEEVVNDAYLRAWNAIPPERPECLRAYLAVVCSRLALDRYDRLTAEKRGGGQLAAALDELAECVSGGGDPADDVVLRDALNRFLRSLSEKARTAFLRRYWYACSIGEIAASLHMSESGVKMLLVRTRKKLKRFLQKEGLDT